MGLKVSELKDEAKRLGLRRYSKLRKAELINVHERERERVRNPTPIFDEPVPEINSQILQPTKAVEKIQKKGEEEKKQIFRLKKKQIDAKKSENSRKCLD